MIRVSGGTAKNKKLIPPDIEDFRAVQEIAKQAAFSIIGDKIKDAVCLDLYSGSGNLGIEALSRGAKRCDFVDENYEAYGVISENVKRSGFIEKAGFFKKDAVKFVANTAQKYDIIFADPFYDTTAHVFLMKNIAKILNDGGIIVFFHGKNLDFPSLIKDTGLKIITERQFGGSLFEILTK
jgi:16S rRNA (guanine966-N2)-methyltransferase